MSTLAITAIVVAVWLTLALGVALLLGRAVNRNTADPPEPEDWLRADDADLDFDWPQRKEAA